MGMIPPPVGKFVANYNEIPCHDTSLFKEFTADKGVFIVYRSARAM